jgi:hypothetical protein
MTYIYLTIPFLPCYTPHFVASLYLRHFIKANFFLIAIEGLNSWKHRIDRMGGIHYITY